MACIASETARLTALHDLKILDTNPERHLDAVCRIAAELFRVPIAVVPLVDEARLWFKAGVGVTVEGISRSGAFCDHTIRLPPMEALVVRDTLADERFIRSPLVTGLPHARFYAGVPFACRAGYNVGTLGLIDTVTRPDFGAAQVRQLQDLARIVEAHLHLHEAQLGHHAEMEERMRVERRLRAARESQAIAERTARFGHWRINAAERTIAWSEGIARVFGWNSDLDVLTLDRHIGSYHPEDRDRVRRNIDEALAGRSMLSGGGYEHTSRVVRPDGTTRVVTVHGAAEHDGQGRLVTLHGICLDVTELVRSEQSQRETSEFLRTTLEAMGQGLLMIGPDDRVRIHNRRAHDLLGLPEDLLFDGAPFEPIRQFQRTGGEYDPTSDRLNRPAEQAEPEALVFEQTRPDGAILEVRTVPLYGGGTVRTFTDVTKRREGERAVQRSEQRFRLLAENTTDIIIWSELDTTRRYVSPAAKRVLGYDPEELVGTRPLGFVHPDDAERYGAILQGLQRGELETAICQTRYRRKDGSYVWVEVSFSLTRDAATGCPDGYVASLRDIAARKEAEQQIAHMAVHDALTGLPNRLLFRERLEQELADVRRRGGTFAVLACDLDRFKAVNDTLGHPAGDALLGVVADRLRAVVREGDTVARLGGDEFAIILGRLESPQAANATALRVIEALGQPVDLDGSCANIGVSIGIALGPQDGEDADILFKNADIALYRAKAAGRNMCSFYEAGMDTAIATRNLLELDLRNAVRRGGFDIYYQPIMKLAGEAIGGFEALLRWQHPLRGPVSPVEFIPLAEETGLIVTLGAWVLHEACREAATWPCDLTIAVNVSAVQFQQPGLEQAVVAALAASGLAANRLELEITESVLMQDSKAVVACLHRLRGLGVRIALDDFGTGYSSLSYLRRFPFDKIKIDRAFVRDIDNPDTAAIVQAIVGIGERLGAAITAEGVETEAQFERVRQEGCTEIQGFLISKPVPAIAVPPLLQAVAERKAA